MVDAEAEALLEGRVSSSSSRPRSSAWALRWPLPTSVDVERSHVPSASLEMSYVVGMDHIAGMDRIAGADHRLQMDHIAPDWTQAADATLPNAFRDLKPVNLIGVVSTSFAGMATELGCLFAFVDDDVVATPAFAAAREALQSVRDLGVREQCASLLDALADRFVERDFGYLPHLSVSETEAGAALLEWTLPSRRLGFTLEPDKAESGWYFATTDPQPEAKFGFMATADLSALLSLLTSCEESEEATG